MQCTAVSLPASAESRMSGDLGGGDGAEGNQGKEPRAQNLC